MTTVRLIYPETAGGGFMTYALGAQLLTATASQRTLTVPYDATPPAHQVTAGLSDKTQVISGIHAASDVLRRAAPDRVITFGGNCLASFAPFDYLRDRYRDERVGIIWIDAHPDIENAAGGYPNTHAMVLGALTDLGEPQLVEERHSRGFAPDDILFVGLMPLSESQTTFLREGGFSWQIQDKAALTPESVAQFCQRFDRVVVHLDMDAIDMNLNHATYAANPAWRFEGIITGRMTFEELGAILEAVDTHADLVGFTIAEYLPFEAGTLRNTVSRLKLFQ